MNYILNSAGLEKDEDDKTPKANIRQARINDTRPQLIWNDTKSLATIQE